MTKQGAGIKEATGKSRAVKAGAATGVWAMKQGAVTGSIFTYEAVIEAVMGAAGRSGLLDDKSGRIGGRVSRELVEKAKAKTGIDSDTDLIEFALANVALEDNFAATFKAVKGKVDPDLKLGF